MDEKWNEISQPENREEKEGEAISLEESVSQEESASGEELFQEEEAVKKEMEAEKKSLAQEIERIGKEEKKEEKRMDERMENSYSYSHIPEEPEKPGKKKGGFWKKAAGVLLAAVVFGLVAGGTMVGINALYGNNAKNEASKEPSQNKNQANKEGGGSENNGSNIISTQATGQVQLLDVSDVVSAAMPSVVAITNELEYTSSNMWGQSQIQKAKGSGSGVIIGKSDTELLIVTNAHVVSTSGENNTYYEISAAGLKVTFADGTEVEANLKGSDSDADLAVIAVPLSSLSGETLEKVSIASIGDSDELKVGNGVIAIGNALGYGQSVTVGYVSALNREVTIGGVTRTMIQTDAAINPGNSGGALLNTKGELIGINAAKYSQESVEGIGYAIPITKAMDIIENLKVKEKSTKVEVSEEEQGYLGIRGATVDNTSIQIYGMPAGVYVGEVVQGGPASGSELRSKDIITKFDGETVSSMADLQNLLKYYKGQETVSLTVKRLEEGQYVEKTFDITLGFAKDAETDN